MSETTPATTPAPTPTPEASPPPPQPEPVVEAAAEPAEPTQDQTPDGAQPEADPRIAALEAALAQASNDARAAAERVAALEAKGVEDRRAAALAKMGLPDHFHALAPTGDPADPKVREALDKFAADPKYVNVFKARVTTEVDVAENLDARIQGKSNVFTNPKKRTESWREIKYGER